MTSSLQQQQDALAGLPVGLLPIIHRLHPGGFFVFRNLRRSNASALATSNAGFLASVLSPEGVVEPLLQAGGSNGTHRLGKRDATSTADVRQKAGPHLVR